MVGIVTGSGSWYFSWPGQPGQVDLEKITGLQRTTLTANLHTSLKLAEITNEIFFFYAGTEASTASPTLTPSSDLSITHQRPRLCPLTSDLNTLFLVVRPECSAV